MQRPNVSRVFLRAASRIHQSLQAARQDQLPALPQSAWQALQAVHGRLKLAIDRSFTAAATQLRGEFGYAALTLTRCLEECRGNGFSRQYGAVVSSVGEIYRELLALEQEFDNLQIDLQARTMSVVTEPIVLEHVDLGRFEILLRWDRPDDELIYDVVALDANSASTDSDITHPHVREQQLCEGDGRLPIRLALLQGRLLDFFVLVRQVLNTYNADSAYVQLDRWHGRGCPDCGLVVHADDSTCCERCDSDICNECSSCCRDCGRSCCSECRAMCPACEQDHCRLCLRKCSRCGSGVCPSCLTSGVCPNCQENQGDDQNDQGQRHEECQSETTSEHVEAPLQPVCLGEAVVPT